MESKGLTRIITRNALRLGVPQEEAYRNALVFSELVGHMENNGKLTGNNPRSTAKGLYQFLRGSIEPALNRLERYLHEPWMDTLRVTKDMNGLSWEHQTMVFLADLFEKKGSDRYMAGVLRGTRSFMLQAYLVLHHTDPDEKTLRRARRIFIEEFQ